MSSVLAFSFEDRQGERKRERLSIGSCCILLDFLIPLYVCTVYMDRGIESLHATVKLIMFLPVSLPINAQHNTGTSQHLVVLKFCPNNTKACITSYKKHACKLDEKAINARSRLLVYLRLQYHSARIEVGLLLLL